MAGVIENLGAEISSYYTVFTDMLPPWGQEMVMLFTLVILIFFYSLFIWKFYKFIATKNLLGLNLSKYSTSEHPFFSKLVGALLYFLEYIIILPFLIFFWFSIFTLFLIFLTENLESGALLMISAVIISAIRMTSYYSEDLSKDLAKMLPFTLLSISILNPGFFNLERVFSQFAQIPMFFDTIIIYLLFIIVLEVILRLFDFAFSLFGLGDVPEVEGKI